MKKVCVFFAEGFEEIEGLTIVDVLRRANIETKMVSINNCLEVVGAHNIKIETDNLINKIDFEKIDLLVLPGGMPGSANLKESKELNEIIMKFNKENKLLAAICAAPMVYGSLGILKGKEATSYPGYEKYLEGAKLSKDKVVVSDNFITSKGPGTSLYFSLKLVEVLVGEKTAEELKKAMLID